MAVVNTGMSKGDMKKVLSRSKEEPVHVAVGTGDNAAMGLLVMHKQKKERAVEALLKADFPNAKNTRWGTAFVDVDDNPKLVKFTLNKPVSGMARKLIKTLKGTGFSKVVILTEDGSPMDSFEEEDEEAAVPEAGSAAAPPPSAPPPPAAEATPEQKAARTAALAKALAALVPGIAAAAGGDPARKAALEKLARDAGVNIKTGNLEYGANFVAQLKKALEGGGTPGNGEAKDGEALPGGGRVEFARLRLAWDDARKHLAGQLGTLKAAIIEQSADEEDAADIKANAGAVEEALSHFDDDLSDALDVLYNAGGTNAGLQRAARALALSYQAFLGSDPLMQDLDSNPFVPLDARKRLDGALGSIIARL